MLVVFSLKELCPLRVFVRICFVYIAGLDSFRVILPGVTGPEPAGDRLSVELLRFVAMIKSERFYDCWNLRGPPLGEAPARSSLVPRDLTAELCLIASRFARGFLHV